MGGGGRVGIRTGAQRRRAGDERQRSRAPTDLTHEEVTELLGAYALDAVDEDERALVEEHLGLCARCRAEVQAHRETATLLARRPRRAR